MCVVSGCLEITQANKIPYVSSLWREGNEVRIESLTIGNTSQWIEQYYGEEAMYTVVGTDLADFEFADFRNSFLKPFPKIKRKIDGYEQVIRDVANKHNVRLEIRYEGSEGLASLYLDAVVIPNPQDIKSELKAISSAIEALEEAYGQIDE